MGDWLLMDEHSVEAAGRLALAALLGGIIGFEREWNGHPAGLRTNMLVALGCCLFTILSIQGFPLRGTALDTSRVASQILPGIGFLGAGVVLQTRRNVRGLTTAATIWTVAALGMAVGAGNYFLGIFTTLLTVLVLALLYPLSRAITRRRQGRAPQGE